VVSSSSKKCLWYKIGVARVACRSIAVALFVFIGVYVARAGIIMQAAYESLPYECRRMPWYETPIYTYVVCMVVRTYGVHGFIIIWR
jgi:hypothetical protein